MVRFTWKSQGAALPIVWPKNGSSPISPVTAKSITPFTLQGVPRRGVALQSKWISFPKIYKVMRTEHAQSDRD
ncbi:hypothetical protein QJS04_geneDACA006682 [Acorus gramineus]|uniref:Uncharacterized protein n=1 Tax=Acorus gramineus TaxID=55184 RepID=A0AAV9AVW5_ACOGR|nr:hypothetical protein QJS04_geneDACA006682 [Acorus gramineus]